MKQSTKSPGNKSNKPDSYDDREDNPEHDLLPRIASRLINLLFIGGVLLLSTASTALFAALRQQHCLTRRSQQNGKRRAVRRERLSRRSGRDYCSQVYQCDLRSACSGLRIKLIATRCALLARWLRRVA